ncbi:hypothetical protein VTO42DRAFT_229 [Malbranchea cinnamomea]
MASSLAAQLSQIAATSTHQLDLRAQRIAHSQSLIFDKKVAISQDFDTIFQICHEGFRELCALDPRFAVFERTIFSEQSKTEERGQMTASQNKELDSVLESFLALVGGRLLLKPAVKAVDWLVRRFRVHEYNTSFLILTFLPYHTTPLFLNLLSILPQDLTPTFKFLYPYKRSLILPPRHPIVHSASTNKPFFAALNDYVLQVSKAQCEYQGLISFWAGIIAEALVTMLDSTRSGRLEIERRNQEDILLRILPFLNDAFFLKNVPQLTIGSFMLCVVLANKASLADDVLDSLMDAVVGAWTDETVVAGITCLSVLAQRKSNKELPARVIRSILQMENSVDVLEEVNQRYSVAELTVQLARGSALSATERRDGRYFEFVDQIIQRRVLDDSATAQVMIILLQTAQDLQKQGRLDEEARQRISDIFLRLKESDCLGPLFQSALRNSGVDISALEMSLETMIATELVDAASAGDVEMADVADVEPKKDVFTESMQSLRNLTVKEGTFLGKTTPAFESLARAFIQASGDEKKLSLFSGLTVLKRDKASEEPLYFSFFVRFFSGPYPPAPRALAIKAVTSFLHNLSDKSIDLQALLPYNVAALMDPSERVRREAAALLAEIHRKCPKPKADEKTSHNVWGRDQLYGSNKLSGGLQWLETRNTYKVVGRALLPALEEYILDPAHVSRVLVNAIRGSQDPEATGSKVPDADLKKSVRHELFSFLCSHAVMSPLYSVKLRLLRILNQIEKVGSSTRTQLLLSLLTQWEALSPEDAKEVEDRERIPIREIEHHVFSIIAARDHDAFDILFKSVMGQQDKARPSFMDAAFDRLKTLWPSFKEEQELAAADKLLEISLADSGVTDSLASHCKGLLRGVSLSGTVLAHFMNKVLGSVSDLDSQAPARKKRRTSENKLVALNATDRTEVDRTIQNMAYIMELIDGSKPEDHPELTKGLMEILGAVHQLKLRVQSEMSYLLSLILGILLAIVNKMKDAPARKLDASAIKADLIIDCVRTSESPQVQNTGLLLVAGLATIAPEAVLHSVMPIFTFMGSNVLNKDDAYSSLVIDQTIDQVVPPLIHSLRKQKRDVVSSTSELLLSFTAAFEHIPSYRRLRLFETLITKLGTADFLFAVFAMLANKYPMNKDVMTLMTSLASSANAETQLTTYARYLNLVRDTLQPKPNLSRTLLGVGSEDGREPHAVAIDLLQTLSYLLKHTSLASKMSKYFESDQDENSAVNTLFSTILEQILDLSDSVRTVKPLSKACGDTLGTFLGTLSLVDFIDTVEVLLGRPSDDLRRRVLRLTEMRLDSTQSKDSTSRTRALEFSSVLVNMLQSSSDILLKHAAVACLERISEKYGKKDPAKVVTAAKAIASEHCTGQSDDRIRVMGVLCLASMTEVLGEGIIPVLPGALPRAFDLLQGSLADGDEKPSLHDAVYSFISALLIHVPWMISGDHLDNILRLSFLSANRDLPEGCEENRKEALQLLSKRVDVKEAFTSVERNWPSAVSQGPKAVNEALAIVRFAIDKHPKSSTIKNVPILMKLLRNAFDLRRIQLSGAADSSFDVDDIEEVETRVNEVTIRMIYKLNDTIFRPLFIELTDWAFKGVGQNDKAGRLARTTTFYRFLETFFGTLKSIVTGYSSYIIENAVEVLKNSRCNDKNTKTLWLATLRTLRNSFEHDQDEFWQSPTHLTAIASPLIHQLSHATNQSTLNQTISELIPTIVELASAADSPDNHKELNTAIMRFMRAGGANSLGDNSYTRLAAVKCEQALTERLGEEWLSLLPEMLPYISELLEDDDETVEKEVRKWVLSIEEVLGEKLDDMLV